MGILIPGNFVILKSSAAGKHQVYHLGEMVRAFQFVASILVIVLMVPIGIPTPESTAHCSSCHRTRTSGSLCSHVRTRGSATSSFPCCEITSETPAQTENPTLIPLKYHAEPVYRESEPEQRHPLFSPAQRTASQCLTQAHLCTFRI
jgi:hypothetical protein